MGSLRGQGSGREALDEVAADHLPRRRPTEPRNEFPSPHPWSPALIGGAIAAGVVWEPLTTDFLPVSRRQTNVTVL